jgi:hypothetical protein
MVAESIGWHKPTGLRGWTARVSQDSKQSAVRDTFGSEHDLARSPLSSVWPHNPLLALEVNKREFGFGTKLPNPDMVKKLERWTNL